MTTIEFTFEVIETVTHHCVITRTFSDIFDETVEEDKCWTELENKIADGTWRETIEDSEGSEVEIFMYEYCTEVLD